MNIKTKLTINVVAVVIIIGAISTASYLGMKFVKGKLAYLTEKSSPYQIHTVELQRAIQAVIANLNKIVGIQNSTDFATAKTEAAQSLNAVKAVQTILETMSSEKMSSYDDLEKIYTGITTTTENRLKAIATADAAEKSLRKKRSENAVRLNDLDKQIKGLQASRSASYAVSADDKDAILSKVRSLEMLKTILKDLRISVYEASKTGKNDMPSLINRAAQNSFVRGNPKISADFKVLAAKVEELAKNKEGDGFSSRMTEVNRQLDDLIEAISDEADKEDERYGVINGKQGNFKTQSSVAGKAMAVNTELLSLGLKVEGMVPRLFIVKTESELNETASLINETYAKIDATQKNLTQLLKQLGADKELRILSSGVSSLNGIRDGLFSADGVVATLKRVIEMQTQSNEMTNKLRDLVLVQVAHGKKTATTAQGEQEKAISMVNQVVKLNTTLILVIGLVSIAFGISFGIWIYRSIARPLTELQTTTELVAKGDLTKSTSSVANDEVGVVQQSVGEMVTNLRGMVQNIHSATSRLAGSAEELSATAVQLGEGSSRATSQIEQAAAAMTEMTQSTLEVARNSSQTAEVASHMKLAALDGKDSMQQMVNEFDRFTESVRIAALEVEGMGEHSEKIGEVVILIKDIADQTNLLALNAAIEAARAGDSGRGFAVVADNVRALSQRTTQATEEINQMVKEMQSRVVQSVGTMQQERRSLDTVVTRVDFTLSKIDEIVVFVEQVTDMVQKIAVASEEQSATSEEINHNMATIAAVNGDLAGSSLSIKNSAVDLSLLAQKLKEMVGEFKV